jgi:Ser/Thr protein kinase RdoA (MazF antagonist)
VTVLSLRRLHHDATAPEDLSYFGGGISWWPSLIALADRERRKPAACALVAPTMLEQIYTSVVRAADGAAEIGVAFIHGDCTPYHWILHSGEVVGLIDFGEAGLGDPAWDLVVLTRWDPDELPEVLAGYDADAAFDAHVNDVYTPYAALRILIALNWLAEHGRDPSPDVSELVRFVGAAQC